MSSSNPIRWGAAGFMMGGVVWVISGFLVVFGHPMMGPHPVYFPLVVVALLLTSVGLVGLHALQKRSYGRIGRASFYAVLIATLAQTLDAMAPLVGSPAFAWLVSPVGFLGVLVGFVLYGAVTLRARVLPRWYGVALIILQPVSVVLLLYGNIWRGLVLLVLGYALWSRRGTPTEQPSLAS